MRNSFVMYTDYEDQINLLTDAQCGVLLRAIIAYTAQKDLPEMDAITTMAFSIIRQRLNKDRESYDKKCEKNKQNARMRWDANGCDRIVSHEVACGRIDSHEVASSRIDSHSDNDNDIDNDNDLKEKNTKKEKSDRFTPPTLEEVAAYCRERKNNINAEAFVDFYTAKGWKVGSQSMKDWKACVRTWEKRNKESVKKQNKFSTFKQRDYDFAALEADLLGFGGTG